MLVSPSWHCCRLRVEAGERCVGWNGQFCFSRKAQASDHRFRRQFASGVDGSIWLSSSIETGPDRGGRSRLSHADGQGGHDVSDPQTAFMLGQDGGDRDWANSQPLRSSHNFDLPQRTPSGSAYRGLCCKLGFLVPAADQLSGCGGYRRLVLIKPLCRMEHAGAHSRGGADFIGDLFSEFVQ